MLFSWRTLSRRIYALLSRQLFILILFLFLSASSSYTVSLVRLCFPYFSVFYSLLLFAFLSLSRSHPFARRLLFLFIPLALLLFFSPTFFFLSSPSWGSFSICFTASLQFARVYLSASKSEGNFDTGKQCPPCAQRSMAIPASPVNLYCRPYLSYTPFSFAPLSLSLAADNVLRVFQCPIRTNSLPVISQSLGQVSHLTNTRRRFTTGNATGTPTPVIDYFLFRCSAFSTSSLIRNDALEFADTIEHLFFPTQQNEYVKKTP